MTRVEYYMREDESMVNIMNQPDPYRIVDLNRTSEQAYCKAALRMHHNEFWWYFNGLAAYKGYSKPFADRNGRWWYHIKPGLACPVNFFRTFEQFLSLPFPKGILGCQYPVAKEQANSFVRMNVIRSLSGYEIASLSSTKRRATRKGLRGLSIEVVDPSDSEVAKEARIIWNSHVDRTGWNSQMTFKRFSDSWAELAEWPGTTILAAKDLEKGHICAWLIARVIDDVVYVDTIASHTDRLDKRPNDTIIFIALISAARQGIKRAHYSLESRLRSLEKFKKSLGFETYPFPARLRLRWPISFLLRLFNRRAYRRLLGDPNWADE